MKILQVTPFFPPHTGGIEYYVSDLSTKLVEEGHDVTVYTSNVPKTKEYEVINGVKIYRFNSLFSYLNNYFMPTLFIKLMQKNDFDVVHVHGYLHFSTNVTALSKLVTKKPVILTTHGCSLGYADWKKHIESTYNKTLGALTIHLSDKIWALNPEEIKLLEHLGANKNKLSLIVPGIELNKVIIDDCVEFKKKHKLENKQVILFVGGLIARKGINYLVDAMKHIESDAILLIAGGELQSHPGVKEALEKQISDLGLKDKIIFLGNLDRNEVQKAYNAADVFVLPSLSEGLPLVIIEAMAHNKCVIASNVQGNTTIVKDCETGLLFKTKDSKQLAKKIDLALKNPEIRKQVETNAKKEIEEKYSSDIVIHKIIQTYEKLVNETQKS